MACVFLPKTGCWQQDIPSSLDRLTFRAFSLTIDTSKVYIQGKIKQKWQYCNAKRSFLKIQLEEEETRDLITVYLIEEVGEKCKNVDLDDVCIITAFNIEMNNMPADDNNNYQVIVKPASKDNPRVAATVWVRTPNQVSDDANGVQEASSVTPPRKDSKSAIADTGRTLSTGNGHSSSKSGVEEMRSSHANSPASKKSIAIMGSLTPKKSSVTTRSSTRENSSTVSSSSALRSTSSTSKPEKSSAVSISSTPKKSGATTSRSSPKTSDTISCSSNLEKSSTVGNSSKPKKSSTAVSRSTPKKSSASSDKSSQCTKPKSICPPYTYVNLCDVKIGATVNVFGVVKFYRPVMKSRGTDFNMMISIVDSTLVGHVKKLKCMLFARESSLLPEVEVGDVIRLHRLKIVPFNNEMQGQAGPGFSWVTFNPHIVDDELTPKSKSSPNYTFTKEDEKTVRELIDWSLGDESLLSQNVAVQPSLPEGLITLSSVSMNNYFDLVCQVVGTCVVFVNRERSKLLRVWDGTKVPGLLFEQDFTDENLKSTLKVDEQLVNDAKGYMVDIWVYDEHFDKTLNIEPGDFVYLTNVHAMMHRDTEQDRAIDRTSPLMELCLHGGGAKYNRGIKLLDVNSNMVRNLKLVLSECLECENSMSYYDPLSMPVNTDNATENIAENTNSSDGMTDTFVSAQSDIMTIESASSSQDVSVAREPVTSRKRSASKETSLLLSDSECDVDIPEKVLIGNNGAVSIPPASIHHTEDRCTLKTATVVKNHHQVSLKPLSDVITHETPSKFRVSANVIDYSPKSPTPSDIMRLFCPKCNFVCPVPLERSGIDVNEERTSIISRSLVVPHHKDGIVSIYLCPKCNKTPNGDDTDKEQVFLSYIFMLDFVLDDGTGWLSAILCREAAFNVSLASGDLAEVSEIVIQHEPCLIKVEFFHGLNPTEVLKSTEHFDGIRRRLNDMCSSERTSRTMECCLLSYSTPCGRSYQIFDTELSLDSQ